MSLLNEYQQQMNEMSIPKTLLELYEEQLKDETKTTLVTSLLEAVENSRSSRILKEEIFEEYCSQHRAHQIEAINSTNGVNKGQIIIPTGTGKTRVQVHLHIKDMLEKTKQGKVGVYVIGAHRLLLCKQLMDELQSLCLNIGIPINALYVGSARHDEKDIYDQYFHQGIDSTNYESTYTTVGDDVKSFYDKTIASNRHLIIVSTYHSFDKLQHIDNIDLCTYDEAHTTISDDFSENILSVMHKIKLNFFFTATRKINGDSRGMNDVDFYGEILMTVSPTEMIEAGEIIMPKIHTINLNDGRSGIVSIHNELMLIKTIQEAFIEHKRKLHEDSACPNKIGAKLLVSMKGSNELEIVQNSEEFQAWCISNNIKVYAYSSRFGNYENFIEQVNRSKAYDNMKNLSDEEDCILLHIDILTEGIDLPSITGVLLLKHLNEAKLFQSLGRALRLLKADRMKLYQKTMLPTEREKFIKPYAYLILPMHFEEMDESSEEMMETLHRVVESYGVPTEEFLPPEEYDGITHDYLDPITNRDTINNKDKMYPLIHAVQEMVINKMKNGLPTDFLERYNKLIELLK